MKKIIMLLGVTAIVTGCGENSKHIGIHGKTEQDEISVVGKIPGRIESLFVSEGDFVSKGDTLAILDAPEVDAKRAQAAGGRLLPLFKPLTSSLETSPTVCTEPS